VDETHIDRQNPGGGKATLPPLMDELAKKPTASESEDQAKIGLELGKQIAAQFQFAPVVAKE
jgi:hypothetical protein